MLRLIFWLLIAANAGLFAFHQGLFSASAQAKHEPERMQRQLNADRITLLPADETKTSNRSDKTDQTEKPAISAPTTEEPQEAKRVECVEIGVFPLSQTNRIEARLATLNLGKNQTRVNAEEVSSYMVYIPPLGSKEAADKKVAELKERGVGNYYIMSDGGPYRWAISLGVFKSEQAAKNHLATLTSSGVKGVRISPRTALSENVAYRLRNLDAASMKALDTIMSDFPEQRKRACKP